MPATQRPFESVGEWEMAKGQLTSGQSALLLMLYSSFFAPSYSQPNIFH
jgi:hypothetical protein